MELLSVFFSYDAVNQGATNILVRTVDTYVIVILVGFFKIYIHSPINIWVAFGTWKNFRYYSNICQVLGGEKSRAIPFFHAFSGCDTTSQFHGKAKKSVWEAWKSFPQATVAFAHILHESFQPLTLQSKLFETLEHFTCVLYD